MSTIENKQFDSIRDMINSLIPVLAKDTADIGISAMVDLLVNVMLNDLSNKDKLIKYISEVWDIAETRRCAPSQISTETKLVKMPGRCC